MEKISALTSCLLLTVGGTTAESGPAQFQVSERLLPQWATGLIAVGVFLFLSFVGLLMKKAWCEETKRVRSAPSSLSRDKDPVVTNNMDNISLNMVRSHEDKNAFNNIVMDNTEDRVTSM